MSSYFRLLTKNDFRDYVVPKYNKRLLTVPVTTYELRDKDSTYYSRYCLYNLEYRYSGTIVAESYMRIRNDFMRGILYDLDDTRYRYYMACLVYDVMDALFLSELEEEKKLKIIMALKSLGSWASRCVFNLVESAFVRSAHDSAWLEKFDFTKKVLQEYDSCAMEMRWDLVYVKFFDPSYDEYLMAKKLNHLNNYKYTQNETLCHFLLGMMFRIVKQYDDYSKLFHMNGDSPITLKNNTYYIIARVLNHCYMRLYAIYSDGNMARLDTYSFQDRCMPSLFPDFFACDNIDHMIDNELKAMMPLDIDIVRSLYKSDDQLWKPELKGMAAQVKMDKNLDAYIDKVRDLIDRTTRCFNAPILYKDAIKPLAKKRREVALSLCFDATVMYGCRFSPTAPTIKALFPTAEKDMDFKLLVREYMRKHCSREEAEEMIMSFYAPRRRKIVISEENLADKEKAFTTTSSMLDEILAEDEPAKTLEMVGVQAVAPDSNEAMIVEAFRNNGFSMTSEQVKALADSLGTMASLMIDSINENHFEELDDNLIEQDGDEFTMNQEYINFLSL